MKKERRERRLERGFWDRRRPERLLQLTGPFWVDPIINERPSEHPGEPDDQNLCGGRQARLRDDAVVHLLNFFGA